MTHDRRAFLRIAAQTAIAVPAASAALAQKHHTTAAPAPAPGPFAHHGSVQLNVRELGATGDSKTNDTVAVQLALDRCAVLGGGELLFPAGDYVCGTLRIHSNTTVRLAEGATILGSPDIADYPFTQVRWEGKWLKGYSSLITAQDAENITITGKGRIVASPDIKGRYVNADGSPIVRRPPPPGQPRSNVARKDVLRHPALMEFTRCRNLLVQDVVTQGNDMWSTHPVYCENVTFRNVVIHGGADGIDADSCRGVLIDGCEFNTGDDCISLKSGRGMEGNVIGIPCEDVTITNCTFIDHNFACIGIGSETSGGIRGVHIAHCKFVGARSHAIYIKSRPGRGAFIEDIFVDDIDVSGTGQGFLRLNFANSGLQDPFPVPGDAGIPTVRNYRFTNVRVQDVPMLVDAGAITAQKPLTGFTLANVTGTCAKGIELANVHDADLRNIHVTGFTGPLLSTRNVTGKGLTGAVPLPEPKPLDPVETPPETFVLK